MNNGRVMKEKLKPMKKIKKLVNVTLSEYGRAFL